MIKIKRILFATAAVAGGFAFTMSTPAVAGEVCDVAGAPSGTAAGVGALACGAGSSAGGANSITLGAGVATTFDKSILIGDVTTSVGGGPDVVDANGVVTVVAGVGNIAIGIDADAAGGQSIAIGELSKASGIQSTAFGLKTTATDKHAVALGGFADATKAAATAVGWNANAAGVKSTALGDNAKADFDNSSAIGQGAISGAIGATALGQGAVVGAGHDNSVAIGAGTQTTAKNQVAIGGQTADTARTLTGVKAGSSEFDAVNFKQLQDAIGGAGLGGRIDALEDDVDRLDNRVAAVGAVATAMSGGVFLPNKSFNLTGNMGAYDGAFAGALQIGALIGEDTAFNAGVAHGFNKGGKTAVRAGFTFGW